MANVDPQIALATEIGENQGYQTYLISIRSVEANEAVGIEQAKALQAAGIKVIANTGTSIGDGVSSVGELFTSRGGQALGAAVEGLSNTPGGAALLETFGVDLVDDAPVSAAGRGPNGAAA